MCEAQYGTLPTHMAKNPLTWQDKSAWLTPSPPPCRGANTEKLALPELELLICPFKVRRLTVRPIGDTLHRYIQSIGLVDLVDWMDALDLTYLFNELTYSIECLGWISQVDTYSYTIECICSINWIQWSNRLNAWNRFIWWKRSSWSKG